MKHVWPLFRAVLLLVQLSPSASSLTQHCAQLRIPPENVEHALLHIDAFNPIEDMANSACATFGVPAYKCGAVKKEVLETMQEMARLAIREAVVNVSLDRSLAYDILIFDEVMQENVKAPEPLVLYPEEPLGETMREYCVRYNLDNQTCETAAVGIGDLVARDWGCDDPIETEASGGERFVGIPILVDQQEYELKVDTLSDGAIDAVRFCVEKKIDVAGCVALIRIVEGQLELMNLKQVSKDGGEDEDEEDDDWGESTGVRKRLKVHSPTDTRMYPVSERVYIKVDWEHDSDEDIEPEEVCLYVLHITSPMQCFVVPQTDPLYLTANTGEGNHILYFTDKSGEDILAAKVVQLVIPKADLVEIYTSEVKPGSPDDDNEYLVAKIRTTLFDPFDTVFRVCVMIDDSFECLDPEWMATDNHEFRQGTQTEPLHQTITFKSPLDHVAFNRGTGHEISVLLLTANNKAVHLTNTVAFDAALHVNRPEVVSKRHVLDPRIHTPQLPPSCPNLLLSENLDWICDLWRHEWGVYSQNGEDGIIRKIFRHIGTKHKAYVEFGTEDGQECNTRLLREIHGWKGLLMDSGHDDESIDLHREFITRDNLMSLLTEKYQHLVPRDVDLLSIDVDFNDFWLLSSIDLTRVQPRVIIVEVNSHIPPSEARSVQYDDSEDGSSSWDGFSSYFGASVAAFHRWGAVNGYSLVYCESHGVNCFLVHNDALGKINVSALLGPDQLHAPPNFFGQGWSYPDIWQPHHQWVWV
ncbi:unnamed protein product [Phytophthora fragariaefolia]|uniref:Unnamed protein product n=1 Tax=Phytophthora fragariaefolia TaxID=1490495 RepID=A0A9W6TV61_9STRA|nr:unnamed protein product [Phytophthora fragariaefolia]